MNIIKIGARAQLEGDVWDDVKVGYGLVWNESGALYIVQERAIDDGKFITFVLRCITPAPISDHEFGALCQWNVAKSVPIPRHISLVKPNRE